MKYNNLYYFSIFIAIVLFIVILIAYFVNAQKNQVQQEPFIPYIKKLYRPHIRNARLYGSKKIETFRNNIYIYLKKYGIF